ncbi:MAG TPA: hypothetical protein VJH88_00485 [Candidatus Nanoarchaeia archaeon]|nr:hypothetical protein [Candidatus Nanoarchaeia archaeon]
MLGIIDRWKIKRAFARVKEDLSQAKKILSNGIFSLSTEYAKLQLRVQDLERKMEQLEACQHEQSYNYAQSY